MVRMIDPGDGEHLLCMWAPCERDGDTQYEIVVTEPYGVDPGLILRPAPNMNEKWKRVHYLFCSERCKAYYLNSHRDLYNLPSGSKGTLL